MAQFQLEQFDPCPLASKGMLDEGAKGSTQLLALNIESKYLFVDETGEKFHEYFVPGTPDIQNCGGYVDKVIQYRDPALFGYLQAHGISPESFARNAFPILNTRSPRLDLLLYALIHRLLELSPGRRVSLLDHGCTVAEHYDLLDVMLRVSSHGKECAADILSYCGLDKSSMLLSIARLLHHRSMEEHFRLVHAEGSNFSFDNEEFDLSLSVGVVNHVANPIVALEKLLDATRYACVLALWVTSDPEGFWAVNHSGIPNYFFSQRDLAHLLRKRGVGRFCVAEFTPETEASQLRSYIGVGQEKTRSLGSYHLVFSTLPQLPFAAETLSL